MKLRRLAANALWHSPGLGVIKRRNVKKRLTVLAYHRVIDYTDSAFDHYLPNVSTSPDDFSHQMDFIAKNFDVVSLGDVLDTVENNAPLPDFPVLITFDDGYHDNYLNAYPILKQYGFPAVVFLATSRMDDPRALWWDNVSRLFARTSLLHPNFPLLGVQDISNPVRRQWVLDTIIARIKYLPDDEKCEMVGKLRRILDPDGQILSSDTARVFMTWDEARELVANGISCQPHTHNHPILTRINLEMAKTEIECSRQAVKEQLGEEPYAFAYPNGTPEDYNRSIMGILQSLGIRLGFTLRPGTMEQEELRREPLEIRRHYIGIRDTREVFAARLVGVLGLG